jgi:hypothetical protein
MMPLSLAIANTISTPTATILDKIPAKGSMSIIYDPANGDVYSMTDWPNPVVNVFHGTAKVASISIPQTDDEYQQDEMTVSPVNGNIYYVGIDRVVVIHGTQLLQAIDWHSQNTKTYYAPIAISIDPKTGDVYVANDGITNRQSNSQSDVEVFDKNGKYIKTLHFNEPVIINGLAYDSHNHQLYVVDWNDTLHDKGIDIFNSRKLVQRINFPYKVNGFGGFTGHIIYDYDTGLIYAEELAPPENKNSPFFVGKLAIIRNLSIENEIVIAQQSLGGWGQMSFDPKTNKIYMNLGPIHVIQVIHNRSVSLVPIAISNHYLQVGAVTADVRTDKVYVLVTDWGTDPSYMDIVSLSH